MIAVCIRHVVLTNPRVGAFSLDTCIAEASFDPPIDGQAAIQVSREVRISDVRRALEEPGTIATDHCWLAMVDLDTELREKIAALLGSSESVVVSDWEPWAP